MKKIISILFILLLVIISTVAVASENMIHLLSGSWSKVKLNSSMEDGSSWDHISTFTCSEDSIFSFHYESNQGLVEYDGNGPLILLNDGNGRFSFVVFYTDYGNKYALHANYSISADGNVIAIEGRSGNVHIYEKSN